MTAKEEALKLVERFDEYAQFPIGCALITIDEKLKEVPYINNTSKECKRRIFLMDIRSEINKL